MTAPVMLPARTDVCGLASRAVRAATASAMALVGTADAPRIDPARVAVAYSSERWLRVDGARPTAFAPLSGFFETRDGYVRTHANYPHHRTALLTALALPLHAGPEDLAHALARRDAASVSGAITAAGGLCVPVGVEQPTVDAGLRSAPLVEIRRLGDGPRLPSGSGGPRAPLQGIRVLDLTRVIAGPVATRTLALLGAEVLRVDPPRLPELVHQHLDTGHGKRSALLDLASPVGIARLDALLAVSDVIAVGYRGEGLHRLGITPAALASRRPGVVVLALSAWGDDHRRGFDSLVQAASGIARIEGAGGMPGALPAQALDHSAGYLLASAAIQLLRRRAHEGGSWLARTSLRRVAAELLGMPRTDAPSPGPMISDATGHTQSFDVDGMHVVTAAPAIGYPGGPTAFAAPRPWGRDDPEWLPASG